MNLLADCAFDQPVALNADCATLIRSAGQAADIVRSALRARFTIQGLNTVLMLERAVLGSEVQEARVAFCSWAAHEGLTAKVTGVDPTALGDLAFKFQDGGL
jgi:hypothetical protein